MPIPPESRALAGLPWVGRFALDTRTGQLCRTFEIAEEERAGDKWAELPTCLELYRLYPDGNVGPPNDPLGIR